MQILLAILNILLTGAVAIFIGSVFAICFFILNGYKYDILWKLFVSPLMSVLYFFESRQTLEDTPVHAYKYWFIKFNLTYNKPQLVSIGVNALHTRVEEKAICHIRDSNHVEVPGDTCTCGFYGLKYKWLLRCNPSCISEITKRPDSVLLVVEFYGKVLEATAGYRAQHQRILQIRLRKRCCIKRCWRTTSCVVLGRKTPYKKTPVWFPRSQSLYAVCARHNKDESGEVIEPCFSLEDLANSFGTEVVLR